MLLTGVFTIKLGLFWRFWRCNIQLMNWCAFFLLIFVLFGVQQHPAHELMFIFPGNFRTFRCSTTSGTSTEVDVSWSFSYFSVFCNIRRKNWSRCFLVIFVLVGVRQHPGQELMFIFRNNLTRHVTNSPMCICWRCVMCDNSHQQLADNKDVLVRGLTTHFNRHDNKHNKDVEASGPRTSTILFFQDCGDVVVWVVMWWCGGVAVFLWWWCGVVNIRPENSHFFGVLHLCGGVVVWWCGGVVVWWCLRCVYVEQRCSGPCVMCGNSRQPLADTKDALVADTNRMVRQRVVT